MLILVLSLLCGVSRTRATFVLAVLRLIIKHLIGDSQLEYFPHDMLLDNVPKDPRTIYTYFDLQPRVRSYVCCPSCFALYEPGNTELKTCTELVTPETVCGASLYATRRIRSQFFSRPIRVYVTQSLKDWLGRILSRPDLERHLESFPKKVPGELNDFWDGEAINSFLGPDKLQLFITGGVNGELRLAFSLSMDGFTPFIKTNRSVSVTGIYMACLKFPPDIRYKLENIFLVGVVPGPTKPTLTQINHPVRVLVDELEIFWDPGVYFSRTSLCKEGRLVRLALMVLACDLVAARQIAGLASHSASLFCSLCYLLSSDMENFDIDSWPKRDRLATKQIAFEWRDAESTIQRDKIFKDHGVRWSEFWRLDYWDAVTFTTVDTMHAQWINSVEHHLYDTWGIDPNAGCSDGKLIPKDRFKRPSAKEMVIGIQALNKALEKSNTNPLNDLNKSVLFYMCFDHDLRRAGTKAQLAAALMDWVSLQ